MSLPRIEMTETGKRIRTLRKERKIPIRKIEDIMGISCQAIYRWQRGDALPSIDNLVILADLFGVQIDDIIVTVKD